MGAPVVVVASGGVPVTNVANGVPLTVATNGLGVAVTLAPNSTPVTIEGL